jgi:type VI secretion system secreted protein VgrG
LQEGGQATGSSEARYDFDFIAQPASLPYRAPSVTPVPRATGPQTAVVVGPAGEEIWTDKYGRVKLQFRWDRYGKRDENSSCWVRVSDAWAGSNYGSIHIPRIGQEVVVDFLNGELDRPLVTGRIYNADQMPPFDLPEAATQSGFVTRTPGGTGANANMLRFEDKRGAEQISVHAERNYDVSVENDAEQSVGRDSDVTVANNSTVTVGGSTFSVTKGNSSSIVLGIQDWYVIKQVGVVGSFFGVTGTNVTANGANIGAVGASVHATGSSVSTTGSSVSSTGTSVSRTGVSFHSVGLSIKF